MAKVITYSTAFPSYHPKAGMPTFFVEKFLKSWDRAHTMDELMRTPLIEARLVNLQVYENCEPKHHTIRAGHRFKAGDYFSPRIWGDDINVKSGKKGAYHSKQIIIAPDTLVTGVWNFEIKNEFQGDGWYNFFYLDGKHQTWKDLEKVAANDGLSVEDLVHWFKANDGYFSGKQYKCKFSGQVICWNNKVKYDE